MAFSGYRYIDKVGLPCRYVLTSVHSCSDMAQGLNTVALLSTRRYFTPFNFNPTSTYKFAVNNRPGINGHSKTRSKANLKFRRQIY